jgi:cyanophycinase
MEDELLDTENELNRIKKPFFNHGFKNISIVHTRSNTFTNGDSLNVLLLEADAVWITGGRRWRLAKSYNGTKIISALKTIYQQGKIIAGTSAGASIMGSLLVRGDSSNHTLMMGDYQEGFSMVKSMAIDQHHLARNRQFDLFEIKRKYPDLLGIGIEENTGLILSKGKFNLDYVIGFLRPDNSQG